MQPPVIPTAQRCLNHGDREGAARCPECENVFCRECVTEHDGRMICRGCLETLSQVVEKPRKEWLRNAGGWLAACIGLLLVWFVFFVLGDILVSIPSSFHEGLVVK
ncbi:hypothetical protein [Rubellicoccus peritrichatus]|uniref:Rhomboid family protein n=1 Tax=Rubellicoccus peritrichatus TaxID=3080537 RepID=A0AAQ3QWU1_9BACT|nr:hypothetical protein [Puniceicoccus sp. CR14]WOO42180.1 hypothetical protein RZN69_03700 [Puniceicoccus sp. CR14]